MQNFGKMILVITLLVGLLSTAVAARPANGARDLLQAGTGGYGCTAPDIAHYVAQRAAGPVRIDGRLDEPSWQKAEKSSRFVDMVTGAPRYCGTTRTFTSEYGWKNLTWKLIRPKPAR